MNSLKRTDVLLVGLALLAIFQLSVLASRKGPWAGSSVSWLQVGDSVTMIRSFDSHGEQAPLANGEPTVLLVFRSDCGHCQAVASLWRDWIGESGQGLGVVAVTSDPLERATAFVSQHSLGVEVLTVDEGLRGGPSHPLTARTPWVFFLDGAGVVLTHGHGAQIGDIGAALEGRIVEVAVR